MNAIEHQRDHFNSIAKEYYSARRNKNHLRYKRNLFQYMLHDLQRNKSGQITVLEPMCGYGEGKKIIQDYVCRSIEYEGFDFSDTLIEKVKKEYPTINIWKQDVTTFIPEAGKYDIIILIGGLHHIPDHAADVVKKLFPALKEGGIFINFEPTNNNPIIRLIREKIYRKNHLFDAQTERAFSLKDYNKMFTDAGYRVLRQLYPGLAGYVMYYNPDAFPKLNLGNEKAVDRVFGLEYRLYGTMIGRLFSFCTFSIFEKDCVCRQPNQKGILPPVNACRGI